MMEKWVDRLIWIPIPVRRDRWYPDCKSTPFCTLAKFINIECYMILPVGLWSFANGRATLKDMVKKEKL